MDGSTTTSSYTSSPIMRPTVDSKVPPVDSGLESGYASATSSPSSSTSGLPQITLTKPHIKHLNAQLDRMDAMDRLRFAKVMFPNLYQSTAFGLTGLVTLDMLSKLSSSSSSKEDNIDVIFLDTLHHFQETYDLVDRIQSRYPSTKIHMYRPDGASTADEFAERYGAQLWDLAEELYDWIAKVEPQQRAYADLSVAAVLTGRRRSQGGERDHMQVLEVDEERGIIKFNPLVDWTFAQVKGYVTENNVPYNVLLDRGYKSVGDWHSTSPVGETEDERAGRWKGRDKTECGIHNKKSRYAQFLEEQEQAEEKRRRVEEEEKKSGQQGEEEQKLVKALEEVERQQQQEQQSSSQPVVAHPISVVA